MKIVKNFINAINKAQRIMKIVFCVSEILESASTIIQKHFPDDTKTDLKEVSNDNN